MRFKYVGTAELSRTIIAVALFVLTSCASPEPLVATITELSTCKGQDQIGRPIGISKTFSPSEKYIFVCGKLEVNQQSIALPINWYYEDELIARQILDVKSGYFYSVIEPEGETFLEGTYKIEVILGKRPAYSLEFRIEQP